ncbi:MAG: hydrolase [Alphaproteobacteria bacterium]|nr:hydrolase [Alphaproteobacteria bacterium]
MSYLISADHSLVMFVDIQEKLIPVIHNHEQVITKSHILLKAAASLNIPMLVSEQYTKGLGLTVPMLRSEISKDKIMEKTSFSCYADQAMKERIHQINRKQVIICGIETHICVLQTALHLKEAGFVPFIVSNAVSSRYPHDYKMGLKRMQKAGCMLATLEMVLFEWLKDSSHPDFKNITKLIK